jgi:lysophospholipase L1-like esterase
MSLIRPSALILAVLLPAACLRAQEKPGRFDKEITAFEKQEKDKPVPKDAIIFIGSSSIRLWKLDHSFPSMDVVNRGFGGSHLADSVVYAPRLLVKQQPRIVVLYAGDNDLAVGKTPEQVAADFQDFVKVVQKELPKTKIIYLSIKPSPSRAKLADKAVKANALIAEACKKGERLVFVDVYKPMLGSDDKPRAELFRADNLHMNDMGYDLWTSILKPLLK